MNPILLQKQLKDNANDLKDFCSDLQKWGDEMKIKEETKNKGTTNKDSKKQKVETAEIIEKPKDKPKKLKSKIGATDYAKWDKFDADLECERLEEDIKDDSELTDEFEESVRDEALVHKEKGNTYVKKKEWAKAINCYTNAINCYSYDPIFYANRALCYLKQNNFTAAEADCSLSLRIDKTYVKALLRRAAAREALGKLESAHDDLESVLIHEPKNTESIAALARIKKILKINKPIEDEQRPVSKFIASRNKLNAAKSATTTAPIKTQPLHTLKLDTSVANTSNWPYPGCEIMNVKAIQKPPHLRSKKPLRRIEIQEIDSVSEAEISSENAAVQKHVVEHVSKDTVMAAGEPAASFKNNTERMIKTVDVQQNLKNVTFKKPVGDLLSHNMDARESSESRSAFKRNREKMSSEKNDPLNKSAAWPTPNQKSDIIRSDDLRITEKINSKEVKNTENINITKMDNGSKTVKSIKESKPAITVEYGIPKTSVQFYSTWKTLKSTEDKYKYLKLIQPHEIPNIFRESLESSVFSTILDILSTKFIENNDEVYNFLQNLTQVKRFSALTMFMDLTDKNRLWKLISYLREKSENPKEKIDKLVLDYEL